MFTNLVASALWLREARRKEWRNAELLEHARQQDPAALDARLRQLEQRSRTKMAELLAPGQVLLKLGVRGFDITLSPEQWAKGQDHRWATE